MLITVSQFKLGRTITWASSMAAEIGVAVCEFINWFSSCPQLAHQSVIGKKLGKHRYGSAAIELPYTRISIPAHFP